MTDLAQNESILRKMGACADGANWADSQKSYREAWKSCERGDWMLWIAKKQNVDLKKLTMAKVECAELVKHLMTDVRSINALFVARNFAEGTATREDLNAAADAAVAAYADADAYADAAVAAYAYAAAYAAAAAAAAYAAYAAADADAYADAAVARQDTLKKSADLVRKHISFEDLGIGERND